MTVLLFACFLFLCLLATYITKLTVYKFQVQPDLNSHNEAIDKYLPDFEADRMTVAASSLSMPSLSGSDAGDQLNDQIPWKFFRDQTAKLVIEKRITDLLQSGGTEWSSLGPETYLGLDFSWLTKNFNYSYWSIWNSNQIKNQFDGSALKPSEIPVPDYDQLLYWAQLRYLHGLHNNDLLAAQSEVRQLAHLIETNESALATRTALQIFALETKIALNEKAIAAGFEPIPADLLKKVQAMIWFYESAAHPATRDDLVRKITSYKEPHFGLCGVIARYSWIEAVDVFRPLPFRDTSKILDKFAKSSDCRRQYDQYLYQTPSPDVLLANHAFFKKMAGQKYLYFLFQDTIGLIIDTSTMTDSALFYRQAKKAG